MRPTLSSASSGSGIGAGRPGLAASDGRLYIGWAASTATATVQPLDLGWSVDGGRTVTRLVEAEWVPAGEGPALTGDGAGVDVAWADGNAAGLLTAAYLSGSTISCRTTFGDVTTAHSPALVTATTGLRYLAWTDTAGHLNVGQLDSSTCARTHAMMLTNQVTITGTAANGGPAIIDDGPDGGLGVVLAWTDTLGTLDVGTYGGTPTLTDRIRVMTPSGVSGAPGLGATAADLYIGFVGTDGVVYHAYSEGCAPACFHIAATAAHAAAGYGISSGAGIVWSAYFDTGHHLRIEPF